MARSKIPGSSPRTVPGAPNRIPGAPQFVPGGPSRRYPRFETTVPRQPTASDFRDIHTRQIRDFQGRYAGPNGIAWQGLDVISENLFQLGEDVDRARERATEELKDLMVDHMKANHPWENRTHDAEKGLRGHVVHTQGRSVIWIGHGVHYGIWLEIMQGGRFAIVLPTLMLFGPRVNGQIRSHV